MRDATLRRLVAAEAHRRRTGRWPHTLHSLGTGESFFLADHGGTLRDEETGALLTSTEAGAQVNPGGVVALAMEGDVWFRGQVAATGERFTGRAGGGSSVTLYDEAGDFFQYAVMAPPRG